MNYNNEPFDAHLSTFTAVRNERKRYQAPFPNTFLTHILPTLSSIPLKRNESGKISPDAIVSHISTLSQIDTPNGPISTKNLWYLLQYLKVVPRSCLSSVTQVKEPKLASLTPLVLYANKLYNGIKYEEWEKTDKYMPLFLGDILTPLLDLGEPIYPTKDEIAATRQDSLRFRTGQKAGTLAKLTDYKCAVDSLNGVELPKIALFMLLQTWIAYVGVRDTESMILDPWDWDNTPAAVDEMPTAASPGGVEPPPWI